MEGKLKDETDGIYEFHIMDFLGPILRSQGSTPTLKHYFFPRHIAASPTLAVFNEDIATFAFNIKLIFFYKRTSLYGPSEAMICFDACWTEWIGFQLNMNVEIMLGETPWKSSGWLTMKESSEPADLVSYSLLQQKYPALNGPSGVKFRCKVRKENLCNIKQSGWPLLSDDLAKAVFPDSMDTLFSDINLVCHDRTFPCHKVVLAARSDVFKAMFSHKGSLEVSTSKVEIKDMEPDTLEEMLRFFYTDQVKESVTYKTVCDLLASADKYNIKSLAASCEASIALKINVANCVQALVAAHLHGSDTLKKSALDFAMKNMPELSKTSEWNKIVQSKDDVYVEISRELLKSFVKSNCE